MKLFLTGAAGFVGAETLRLAVQLGHEVFAPIRPRAPAPRLQSFAGHFTRLDVDLRDTQASTEAILATRPDVIIHCAWSGVAGSARFDRLQFLDNVNVSCTLVEAAAAAGATAFIGIGSQGEYGPAPSMREDCLPEPTTLYGAAKLSTLFLTRQLAAQAGIRHAWLRLFSTYGPGDNDGWLIPIVIEEMLAGRRPKITLGEQYWDWLHVTDVARALLFAAASPIAAGIFNLGSGKARRVRRVVEQIRDLVAPRMELVFGEIPYRHDQVMYMQADISRIAAATDWKPLISFEDGLRDTVEWHKSRKRDRLSDAQSAQVPSVLLHDL